MEPDKLCMLCCVNYKHKKNETSSLRTTIRFKKFCKELECFLAERSVAEGGPSKVQLKKARMKGDLNLAYGDLSFCPSCLKRICAAVDAKDNARVMENQIIELQTQLLELMKELDGHMGVFLGKMKIIEEVVKRSDADKLEGYIEENVAPHRKNDAIQFRQRILDAVTDLRIFRQELNDKVVCKDLVVRKEREMIAKRLQNLTDKKTQTDIRGEVASRGLYREEKKKPKVKLKSVTQQTDPIVIMECDETPGVTVKVEVDPLDIEADDSALNFEDCNDMDNYHSDENEVEVSDVKPVPVIQQKPSNSSGRPRRSTAMRKRSSAAKRQRHKSSDSEGSRYSWDDKDSDYDGGGQSDAESNFSDEDPWMQKYKMEEEKEKLSAQKVDLSNLAAYKQRVVRRVLHRYGGDSGNGEDPQSEDANANINEEDLINSFGINPLKKYKIRYISETQSLMLENIEIICLESERCLQCSACDRIIKGSLTKNFSKTREHVKIYNHILGEHLNAFNCAKCSASYKSFKSYKEHVRRHEDPVICDVCGKPLSNTQSLRPHKWLHMSEDEKADAIQRGMTDPIQSKITHKNKPKAFPCGTCGKCFRSVKEVEGHEKIHGEREKVPCHLCGKLLLNNSACLNTHLKYSCRSVEIKTAECNVCHKTFKNSQTLRMHKAKQHPIKELPDYPCTLCGKMFKSNHNLKMHMEIHSDVRAYSCSQCGAAFKQKRNKDRHEKTCKKSINRRSAVSRVKSEHIGEDMNASLQYQASTLENSGHSSSSTSHEILNPIANYGGMGRYGVQENTNYQQPNFFAEFFGQQQRGSGGGALQ